MNIISTNVTVMGSKKCTRNALSLVEFCHNVNLAIAQVALFDGNFSPVSLLEKYLIRNGNCRNTITGLRPPSDTTSESYFTEHEIFRVSLAFNMILKLS